MDVCRIFERGSVQLHLVSEAAIVKLKYGFLTIGKKKKRKKLRPELSAFRSFMPQHVKV